MVRPIRALRITATSCLALSCHSFGSSLGKRFRPWIMKNISERMFSWKSESSASTADLSSKRSLRRRWSCSKTMTLS